MALDQRGQHRRDQVVREGRRAVHPQEATRLPAPDAVER
jgi:hypothetical protein